MSFPPEAAGFSALIQLDRSLINRLLAQSGLFPWTMPIAAAVEFEDIGFAPRFALGATVKDIEVVSGGETAEDQIQIAGTVQGPLTLDLSLEAFDGAPAVPYEITVPIEGRIVVLLSVRIEPISDEESAVVLALDDVIQLDVTIVEGLPPTLRQFLQVVLRRILRTEFRERMSAPLTFAFNHQQRTGVPITRIALRILHAAGSAPLTLTVGFETPRSSGHGDTSAIRFIVPRPWNAEQSNHFAVVTSQELLIEEIWKTRIRPTFPRQDNSIRIHPPLLELRAGYIYLQFVAEKIIKCWPNPKATVKAKLRFDTFFQNGSWHARLDVFQQDVSMSLWDRVLYSLIGGILFGPIGVILVNVVVSVLEGLAEGKLGDLVEAFSVGFKQLIPGTNILVAASTPDPPIIRSDGIIGYGDASLSQAVVQSSRMKKGRELSWDR